MRLLGRQIPLLADGSIAIADLQQDAQPIDDADAAKFYSRLKANYGIESIAWVTDANGTPVTRNGKRIPADTKGTECVRMARELGWTRQHFWQAVNAFLATPKYGTWEPAQLIATPVPSLKTYDWMLTQEVNVRKKLEVYVVPDGDEGKVSLFRQYDGKSIGLDQYRLMQPGEEPQRGQLNNAVDNPRLTEIVNDLTNVKKL